MYCFGRFTLMNTKLSKCSPNLIFPELFNLKPKVVKAHLVPISPFDPYQFFRYKLAINCLFPGIGFVDSVRPKCFYIFKYKEKHDDHENDIHDLKSANSYECYNHLLKILWMVLANFHMVSAIHEYKNLSFE